MNRLGRQLKDVFNLLERNTLNAQARRGGTFYHGKQRGQGWEGGALTPRQGLHVGSKLQAEERVGLASADLDDPSKETPIYDVEVTPRKPYMPGGQVHVESGGGDSRLLLLGLKDEKLLAEGYDVVPYRNWIEEEGALSYRILDPSSVTVNPVAEWGRRDLSKVLRESPYRTYGREVTGRRLPTQEVADENEDENW
tara:strand:+ start:899 stop:1486 length:588 start_codon:yes stop_codon:yes gene_type:complete